MGQEQPAEQPSEYAHRQQERRPRRYPALPTGGDAAAGHDHVHMRMMRHCGSPCVEHGGDADPRAEVLGIGSDGQHRRRRRAEQEIIDRRLVVERDVGHLGG